ncbi:hypothetical protein ABPG72_012832 [Tetrahymena utriculariae]
MESRVLDQKVHYFEHLSVEKFEEYFRGAYHYVVNIVFDRVLRLVKLRYFKDEILLISESLLQSYYLFVHDSTYAEFFFDLKRFTLDGESPSKKSKILAILIQTLVPYIKAKLDRIFNDIKAKLANHDILSKKQEIFRQAYPTLVTVFRAINITLNAKYLLNPQSKFYNLDYFLVKNNLSRKPPQNQQQSNSQSALGNFTDFMRRYMIFMLYLGLQGFDWYFRSSQQRGQQNAKNFSYNESIPPPIQLSAQQQRTSQQSQNFCILCKGKLRNPSVLNSSGYVFCYSCITEFVKNNKKCPVTNIKSDQNMVVKLFTQN